MEQIGKSLNRVSFFKSWQKCWFSVPVLLQGSSLESKDGPEAHVVYKISVFRSVGKHVQLFKMFSLISQYVLIFFLTLEFHHWVQIVVFAMICLLNTLVEVEDCPTGKSSSRINVKEKWNYISE